MSWIDLVTVIQSEESQKEKNITEPTKFQRKTYHANSPAMQEHSPEY